MVLLYEKRDSIAYITLNRPEKLNTLNQELISELERVLADIRDDDNLKVGVIIGAGDRAFCAGNDIAEMEEMGSSFDARDERFWRTFSKSPFALRETGTLWKPLVAAVNGYCLASGVEIALACDIIVATPSARFGIPEVLLGAVASFGGTQRLTRRVPFGMAMEMLLTGENITAEEALRIGLVNRVVPNDQLMATAEELAIKIARHPLHALQANKELAWRGQEMSLADGLRMEKMFSRILREDKEQRLLMKAMVDRLQKR